MQSGFMAGRGTADAIFITKQFQLKYLNMIRNVCFGFEDLKKAFN